GGLQSAPPLLPGRIAFSVGTDQVLVGSDCSGIGATLLVPTMPVKVESRVGRSGKKPAWVRTLDSAAARAPASVGTNDHFNLLPLRAHRRHPPQLHGSAPLN
ncbi:MAG: hypothetical protein WCE80_14915, partial [Acidimicrobiia bacterium]